MVDLQRLEEIAARVDRIAKEISASNPHTGRGLKADAAVLRDLKEHLEVGEGGLREKLLGDDGPVLLKLREEVSAMVVGEGWRDSDGEPMGYNDPAVERAGNALSDCVKDFLSDALPSPVLDGVGGGDTEGCEHEWADPPQAVVDAQGNRKSMCLKCSRYAVLPSAQPDDEDQREHVLAEVKAKLGPLLDAVYEVGSIPDTDEVGAPQDIDGPALWRAVDALQRAVDGLTNEQPQPHREEVADRAECDEALIARVLERFRPSEAWWDMGNGERQGVDWHEVVGIVLAYGGALPTGASPIETAEEFERRAGVLESLAAGHAGAEAYRGAAEFIRLGSTQPAVPSATPPTSTGGGEEPHGIEQIATCLEEALGGPQFKHDVRVVYVRMFAEQMAEFDAWLAMRGKFGEVLTAFRKAFGPALSGTTKEPVTPEDGFDKLEAELAGDPKCARCGQPESSHVPGPPSPPQTAGHLGATEDRPGCCNDFLPPAPLPLRAARPGESHEVYISPQPNQGPEDQPEGEQR